MRLTRRPWIACAAVLLSAGLAAAAPVPDDAGALRYKFKAGDKVNYALTEKSVMEIDLGAGAQKIEATAVFDLAWQVAEVSKAGKCTITQTIDRIRMDAATPLGKITYDSKGGKAPEDEVGKQLADVFGTFAGGEMTLVIDPQGRVESLKYSKKLTEAVGKLPPAAAGVTTSLSEDSFRRMIAQCLPVLPKEAPAKGKAWDSSIKAKFAGSVNFTLDSKSTDEGEVTRGGKKLQKIATKSTVEVNTDPGAAGTIKVNEQDVKSTSYFDKSAGRLAETTFTQKIELEVMENGRTVTIKATTTTTLKQSEKEKPAEKEK